MKLRRERTATTLACHPRGHPDWLDVGVFAKRNKDHPNRILLSTVAGVSIDERSFTVRGVNGIDATPVLDIKPIFVGAYQRRTTSRALGRDSRR